jgi:hypothetical protein
MAARAETLRPAKRQDSNPKVAPAVSTATLIIETLEAAFSQTHGRPVRVRSVERCVFEHISSFHAERLRISLDTGECVPVFFKDLNPNHQIETARRVRANDLGSSYHELSVYQRILSPVNLGTPQLYAVRWEPERDIYWIFLEDVGTSRLRDCRNYERWVPAARWAARFHAATRDLPQSVTSFSPRLRSRALPASRGTSSRDPAGTECVGSYPGYQGARTLLGSHRLVRRAAPHRCPWAILWNEHYDSCAARRSDACCNRLGDGRARPRRL